MGENTFTNYIELETLANLIALGCFHYRKITLFTKDIRLVKNLKRHYNGYYHYSPSRGGYQWVCTSQIKLHLLYTNVEKYYPEYLELINECLNRVLTS